MSRIARVLAATLLAASLAALAPRPAAAQFSGGGWWRTPPRFAEPEDLAQGTFTFCRLYYTSVRSEALGHGWNTDYPGSDSNFMLRLSQLTRVEINTEHDGEPRYLVVHATDDELFACPFVFMSDVGTVGFAPEEVVRLRRYLQAGGFLYVDDFWGDEAWRHWSSELAKVLPPADYPIVDIPLEHDIFKSLYYMHEVPQVPSIQHWHWTGGYSTSERGAESAQAHFRGVFDESGRLMVVMTHNTDIADGWEREGEDEEYFARFSVTKAYPLGINIVLYALSH